MNKKELTFHKSWWAQLWQNHIYMRKTEKIEIHKPDHCQQDDIQEVWCKCGWNDIQRKAAHWWGQVVSGKQPEWRLFLEANVASQAFSAATGRLSCLWYSLVDTVYDTDACQILKEKISTASSPKTRPLQNLVKIWMTSTFGQAWSMINVSKVTPLQKWSFMNFVFFRPSFLDE